MGLTLKLLKHLLENPYQKDLMMETGISLLMPITFLHQPVSKTNIQKQKKNILFLIIECLQVMIYDQESK